MNQEDQTPRASPANPSVERREPIVVGIGASAGGLSALKTFFDHVPEDSGLSFVVVVHLSAQHESHLADLLQFRVKIPVQQVTENAEILPNQVYVIPPGYNLSAIDTHLRLTRLEGRSAARAPIDHFFRTLAAAHDGHAIGVILTGSGSDGTGGVKEVKAKGGLVIVQDPNEAEYDGMPQSAISTGLADLVLPVAQIPAALQRIARTAPQVSVPPEGREEMSTASSIRCCRRSSACCGDAPAVISAITKWPPPCGASLAACNSTTLRICRPIMRSCGPIPKRFGRSPTTFSLR